MMQTIENGVPRDMTRAEIIAWHEATNRPQWPDVETARDEMSARIDADAKVARDLVVAAYSAAEMSSWPIKRSQALRHRATGDDADAPMLVIEAGYRQCSVANLVDLVLAKADVLAGLEARIAGESGYLQDLLQAAETMDDIESFAASQGWLDPRPPMPELPPEVVEPEPPADDDPPGAEPDPVPTDPEQPPDGGFFTPGDDV